MCSSASSTTQHRVVFKRRCPLYLIPVRIELIETKTMGSLKSSKSELIQKYALEIPLMRVVLASCSCTPSGSSVRQHRPGPAPAPTSSFLDLVWELHASTLCEWVLLTGMLANFSLGTKRFPNVTPVGLEKGKMPKVLITEVEGDDGRHAAASFKIFHQTQAVAVFAGRF